MTDFVRKFRRAGLDHPSQRSPRGAVRAEGPGSLWLDLSGRLSCRPELFQEVRHGR